VILPFFFTHHSSKETTMTTVGDQKQFTEPDLPLLIKEVRRLAKAYPDFVYVATASVICDNLTGGCDKYPELCGCIIGQAVRNLGFTVSSDLGSKAVDDLLCELGLGRRVLHNKTNAFSGKWLAFVQTLQDAKRTWNDAAAIADLEYVTVADVLEEQS